MSDHHDDINEPIDDLLQSFYDAEAAAPLPIGFEARVLAGTLEKIASAPLPQAAEAPVAEAAAVRNASVLGKAVALAIASALVGAGIGIAIDRALRKSQTANVAHDSVEKPNELMLDEVSPDGAKRELTLAPTFAPPDMDGGVASNAALDRSRARSRYRKPNFDAETANDAAASKDKETGAQLEENESHLINRARTALGRGLVDEALRATMQHERRFLDGRLAEERDVLTIEAYATKGEVRILRQRIARYRETYPQGFYRRRVKKIEAQVVRSSAEQTN